MRRDRGSALPRHRMREAFSVTLYLCKRFGYVMALLPALAFAQLPAPGKPVNQLPPVANVAGTDLLIDDQSGVTGIATLNQLMAFVSANGSPNLNNATGILPSSALPCAQTVNNLGQIILNVRCYGATGNGTTDDGPAINTVIAQSNTLAAAGTKSCIYFTAGVYHITTSLTQFAQHNPGCVLGQGSHFTYFVIDPAYSGTDLFSWSEAWQFNSYPASGTLLPSADYAGPHVEGVMVIGTTTATPVQNAFTFYDREDHAYFRDVEVYYMHGRCLSMGVYEKNVSQAYARESKFYNFQCWNSGTNTIPAVEINAQGTGDATNEISFYGLDVEQPTGPGLTIRNNNTAAGVRLIRFFGLRAEAGGSTDLVTIGDTVLTGNVEDIRIYGFESNSAASGYNALMITAAGVDSQPYNIWVDGAITTSFGYGVTIDYGDFLWFQLADCSTTSTCFNVGTNAGTNITLDSNGASFTNNILATPTNLRMPTTFAPFTNSVTGAGAFSAGGQANNAGGFLALAAGFDSQARGTESVVFGSRGDDHARPGLFYSGQYFSQTGDSQMGVEVLEGSTSSTAAARLTYGQNVAGSDTCVNIPPNFTYGVSVDMVATDNTTVGHNYSASWGGGSVAPHLLTQGASASTTLFDGVTSAVAPDATRSNGAITGASSSIAADTTNGCLNLSFTPPSGNTDTWHIVATVRTTETH
jgi:Pectate lyase superfamily protein